MPFVPQIPDPAIPTDRCGWGFRSGHRCPGAPIHVVGFHEGGVHKGELLLCHDHYLIAAQEGLIEEPFVGREEFLRRGGKDPGADENAAHTE